MIVHGCIEIHSKGCVGWIIAIEFLLIMHYLIREILVEAILDVHIRDVKIKVSRSRCCNDTSSIKRFMKRYLCWFAYVPHETMVKRMVESTSSSNNVHEVIDDNSNPYRNMVMEAMRMN
jgi:hypothetical protein